MILFSELMLYVLFTLKNKDYNDYNIMYNDFLRFIDKSKYNNIFSYDIINLNNFLELNFNSNNLNLNILDLNDLIIKLNIDKDLFNVNHYKFKDYLIYYEKNTLFDKNNYYCYFNFKNKDYIFKHLNYCFLSLKTVSSFINFNNKVDRLIKINKIEKNIKMLNNQFKGLMYNAFLDISKTYLLNHNDFYYYDFNKIKKTLLKAFNSTNHDYDLKELINQIDKNNINKKYYYKCIAIDYDYYYKELSKIDYIYNDKEKNTIINRIKNDINFKIDKIEYFIKNIVYEYSFKNDIIFNKDIFIKNVISSYSDDINKLNDLKTIYEYQQKKLKIDNINDYYCYSPDLIGEEKMNKHNSINKSEKPISELYCYNSQIFDENQYLTEKTEISYYTE